MPCRLSMRHSQHINVSSCRFCKVTSRVDSRVLTMRCYGDAILIYSRAFCSFSLGRLSPHADIAAKLETMKLFKSFFFKHTYYFGCFCFCLVADVQHQGVMGVVM